MRSLVFAAAALISACASQGVAPLSLTGEWTEATRALRPPTITFEDGRASGFAGCNRWFGAVEASGDSVRFTGVGATRMACEEPMMTIESGFLGALERTRAYRIEGETLILLDDSGAETGRFLRAR